MGPEDLYYVTLNHSHELLCSRTQWRTEISPAQLCPCMSVYFTVTLCHMTITLLSHCHMTVTWASHYCHTMWHDCHMTITLLSHDHHMTTNCTITHHCDTLTITAVLSFSLCIPDLSACNQDLYGNYGNVTVYPITFHLCTSIRQYYTVLVYFYDAI